MVAIPLRSELQVVNRIYEAIEKSKANPDIYLGRIGASFVGEECIRQIWFDWRGFGREKFSGRMLRLFDTGHQQETRIVADLRLAGFSVWDKNEATGNQFEYSHETEHFVTKIDGIIKNVPESDKAHILEIKTHNKNSFTTLVKKGVQEAKPSHYAQMQVSMMLSGLTRALYVSLCKDDEQYYVERVREDKPYQQKLNKKINSLVEARLRPAGISDDASSFGCKFCAYKPVCTKEVEPLRHCRTCAMCTPVAEGKWLCELNKDTLSIDRQRLGCEHYEGL
jgi:CRISPR/Cas system-associated exonuclease Cas4 (RecB family)